ncbi:MAG TPA: 2OG-Fe(II) oxygenase [Rhizomicrobium sp.]|nr:2OG-Fe(II) oxygenase [Rhizomicrobium sp.]
MIDFAAIAGAPVVTDPFPFFTAQGVLDRGTLAAVSRDFPRISQPGIFPLSELQFGENFAALIADVESAELEGVIGEKFGVDLSGKPLMVTVRGFCRARDGRIHNDSKDKMVTCLLYLNAAGWNEQGGRLRLLRGDRDLDDLIAEVPPSGGNFVAFRRTENSWHGHASYEGPRRYIMFNWLTTDTALKRNVGRHKISAAFKRAFERSY